MDTPHIELTVEQRDLLASLVLETGKPIPVLLSEALDLMVKRIRGGRDTSGVYTQPGNLS